MLNEKLNTEQEAEMIKFKHKGNFKNTEKFFTRAKQMKIRSILERYGSEGVTALSRATPVDTGKTSMSWDYMVTVTSKGYSVQWFNRHEVNGANIAILIQYGHGTGTGGYVPPRDYVNPAMNPIFEKMASDIWKEVTSI